MAQRANGYLHAFDGMFLDWDHVFGAGWRAVPREWVSVYRGCSVEELLKIARVGLTAPAPELRPPEVRAELEAIDRFRPHHILRRGVSRLQAIEASLTSEVRRATRRIEAVIEMKVNPAECAVVDQDAIAGATSLLDRRGRKPDRLGGAYRAYWESLVPLKDFKKYYSSIRTADGQQWIRGTRAPKGLPESFFRPEVLVSSPRVSALHVRMVRPEWPDTEEEAGEWGFE